MAAAPEAFLAGIALGLSLAAPPGPVNALMLQASAARGPRAGIPIGLGATTADAGYFLLALAGTLAFLVQRPALLGVLSVVGAALLLYYAWGSWQAGRAAGAPEPAAAAPERSTPAGFRDGFLAAATSPFNLAWWVSTGSVLIAQVGLWLVAGMFAGIVAFVLSFSVAVGHLGRRVRRFQEVMAYLSAALLLGFAGWVALRGAELLGLA